MSDGGNEPIQFTRADAERLATVENDVCHVKKMVNRMLKLTYGAGLAIALMIVKEVYSKLNGG